MEESITRKLLFQSLDLFFKILLFQVAFLVFFFCCYILFLLSSGCFVNAVCGFIPVKELVKYWCQPSWRGLYWLHLVCLSVCPFVRLSILSSNFRKCVVHNFFFFKIHKFEILANSLNLYLWLCLVLTCDPIWINSVVIMGRQGVSSECRRSGCSSCVSFSFVFLKS